MTQNTAIICTFVFNHWVLHADDIYSVSMKETSRGAMAELGVREMIND